MSINLQYAKELCIRVVLFIEYYSHKSCDSCKGNCSSNNIITLLLLSDSNLTRFARVSTEIIKLAPLKLELKLRNSLVPRFL